VSGRQAGLINFFVMKQPILEKSLFHYEGHEEHEEHHQSLTNFRAAWVRAWLESRRLKIGF